MRQPARPDRVDTRVESVRRDASQRQDEVLLPERCDRQQRFQVPPDAALVRTLVRHVAVLDGARVEQERRSRVRDLQPRPLRQLFDQAEVRHFVRSQSGLVIVGTDPVDSDRFPRQEREDEPVSESGVTREGQDSRLSVRCLRRWPASTSTSQRACSELATGPAYMLYSEIERLNEAVQHELSPFATRDEENFLSTIVSLLAPALYDGSQLAQAGSLGCFSRWMKKRGYHGQLSCRWTLGFAARCACYRSRVARRWRLRP